MNQKIRLEAKPLHNVLVLTTKRESTKSCVIRTICSFSMFHAKRYGITSLSSLYQSHCILSY